jgi:hypothetical protein
MIRTNRFAYPTKISMRHSCKTRVASQKPMLRTWDRWFWPLLSRIWKEWKMELILVKPETVIQWSNRRFQGFWRKKSKGKPGRPQIALEHIGFIMRISSDHPEYGEDRIALELEIKFGIRHSSSTVRRYMIRRRPGDTDFHAGKTFLKYQAKSLLNGPHHDCRPAAPYLSDYVPKTI